MRAKRLSAILLSAAMVGTLFPYAAQAVDNVETGTETGVQTVTLVSADNYNLTVSEPTTLVVSGNVTLSGTGDAFDINADTTLVFDQGATLTLSGYTNGFVVESLADSQVTVSTEEMDITASSQMDVFRLRDYGALSLTGDNTITGSGTSGTTNRAIVLEGSNSEYQQVTLAANSTLTATNFYRGMETGGAKNYTISGADMDSSIFDFSGNDCGMALSYFDEHALYTDCKLEVSNCTTSGIFMRQDNAALIDLKLDGVYINCVNDTGFVQDNIAVRFHTGPFTFTDSTINIQNATDTGLWIYDGWDAWRTGSKIENCTVNVTNVDGKIPNDPGKAITLVPKNEWTITGSTFNLDSCDYGGINVACDPQRSGLKMTPNVYGGEITIEDTVINGSNMNEERSAVLGIQPGQSVILGDDVLIQSDSSLNYAILCDDGTESIPYIIEIFGNPVKIELQYDISGMPAEYQNPDRLFVMGGSIWQDPNRSATYFEQSIPVNTAGEKLAMFEVSASVWNTYADTNNSITLMDSNGDTYSYKASRAESDGTRYVWAPSATVSFCNAAGEEIQSDVVMRGAKYGLSGHTLPAAPDGTTWYVNENEPFTADTPITGNMTVTAR